jgi:acyl-CoA synthetase (AMP-forming)/AMP-acid ligase II
MIESWTDVLTEQARSRPHALAVTDDHGHSYTFAHLEHEVEAVSRGWEGLGVRRGNVVALLARNSAELLVNVLALARLAALPALLNWRLSRHELAVLGSLIRPVALAADAEFQAAAEAMIELPVAKVSMHGLPAPDWSRASELRWQLPVGEPTEAAAVDSTSVFALLHTSGTTGQPKIIPLTYRGQLRGARQNAELAPGMGPGAVHLRFSPMFHLAGLQGVLISLLTGGHVRILGDFAPDRWLALVAKTGAAYANLSPAALRMVLDAYDRHTDKPNLSTLKELWYGTAPISESLLRRARDTLSCDFRQNYGMTEAQSPVAQLTPEDHRERPEKLNSVGRPLAQWELRLTDRAGRDVAPDASGEITIRGATLFPGYWPDGVVSAEVLSEDGWYHTGDIGRFDSDGYLYLVDRAKDMIVSGGENIFPAEVEAVLAAHPGVGEVAVIGIPNERWGETVHAVVVPAPHQSITEIEFIEWSWERIAHFKCPTSVDFRAQLPRTATGKVLKRQLRQQYWQEYARNLA